MKCEEVQPKIRLFLEDLLPQFERYAIREHLFVCEKCQEISQGLGVGGFGVKEPAIIVPDQFDDQLSVAAAESKQGEPGLKNRKSSEEELGFPFFKILYGISFLLILGFIFFVIIHYVDSQGKNEISSDFSIQENSQVQSGNTAPKTPLSSQNIPKRDVFLKPLHWDLSLPSAFARETLRSEVRSSGVNLLFDSTGVMVLSSELSKLRALVKEIDETGALLKGGGSVRSIYFPSSDGEIRISMALTAPQSRVSQALTHHWHINFQLPNRFMLKENLKDASAKIVYETPELWVVEVPGPELEHLKEVVRNTHGLTLNLNEDTASSDSYKNIPVNVSFYIEEG